MSFLRNFLLAAALPLLAFLLLGLYLQPLSGDLTRLGNFSERSWGWNRDQPAIHVRANDPRQPASVLVIGDSFSAHNLWQSVAAERLGLAFATFHWSDIGAPGCAPAALRALAQRYPQARTVVIQAVERTLLLRLGYAATDTARCPADFSSSVQTPEGFSAVRRNLYADPMPDPIYAVRALWADLRHRPGTIASGPTTIAPLARSDLFSNRASDAILFHDDDLAKGQWRPEQVEAAIGNIRALAQLGRSLGIRVVFAIVPDKLTIYAPYLSPGAVAPVRTDIWRTLDAAGVASVDLQARFSRQATSVVDFYLPDDTHVGSRGYSEMGDAIADAIARQARQ